MALGQAQDQLGDIVAAVQSYRTSALLDQQRNHHLGSLMALTHLAIKLNSWGRRSEALALCQKTWEEDQFPERRLRGQPWADVIYLAWGLVTYEADELDQAREYVAKALALFQQLGMENIYLATKINLVEIQIAAGKWDAALAMVAQGRQAAMQLQLEDLQALIAAWEAQIRLQQGDIEAASRWAETRNFSTFSRPATWHEQQIDWIYTRLLLAQNRPEEAQTLLVHLEQAARERGRQRSLITIHLLQARTEHALGHEARVSTYLEQALQLAAPEGYLRAFLNEGPLVGGLLPRVRHIAPHFVDSLLRRAGIEAAPFLEQPLPDPLTEREREILHLMAKGWKYQEMADQLFVSINTVRFHAKNLFSKLEVHNRAQAVARARDLNLL
jgi:LuxR family maltose regulon positive regulatory protein